MNFYEGEIERIESSDDISLIRVNTAVGIFTSIVLDSPASAQYLAVGKKVTVQFKETEVILALPGQWIISVRNRITGIVKAISLGKILAQVTLNCEGKDLVSLITSVAAQEMQLKEGYPVVALIKTNEVSLTYHD